MKWIKRFLLITMTLALLAAGLVYVTPLDAYVPRLERLLSEKIHDNVTIRKIRAGLLPLPNLQLEGVRIGAEEGIALGSVRIAPDIRSLFEKQYVLRRVSLQDGSVSLEQLKNLYVMLQSAPSTPQVVRIKEVQFHDMHLLIPKFKLDPLEGKLEFAPDGSLSLGWFAMSTQKISATLRPQSGDAYSLEVRAGAWSPPAFPAYTFERLSVDGVLTRTRLDVQRFVADVQGMHAEGGMSLEWQPQWKLMLKLSRLSGDIGRMMPQGGMELSGDLSGTAQVSAFGATAQDMGKELKVDAQLMMRNAKLNLPASFQHALALDEIQAHVTSSGTEYTLAEVSGRLYGGTLGGHAIIDMSKQQVSAEATFANVATQPLVEVLDKDVALSGKLDATAKLVLDLREPAGFPGNLRLAGRFSMKDGVLGKVDLAQAASHPSRDGNKGGTTRFSELSSLLTIDGSGYHFRQLKVSSGAMNAAGKLDITPQKQLDGYLETDVKGTASLISMPLTVSGTLREPVLRPATSALAGATIGTALLGPGLGTALGIKTSNLLHKLFGKDNDKKADGKAGPASAK